MYGAGGRFCRDIACRPLFTVVFFFFFFCDFGHVDLPPCFPCPVLWAQALLEELENKIKTLETDLYAEGASAATVGKIVNDKEATEARVVKLYKEVRWDYSYTGPMRSNAVDRLIGAVGWLLASG